MLFDLADYAEAPNTMDVPLKGVVIDNNDPEKLGCVLCKVEGLFQDDSDWKPWIYPKNPSGIGGQGATSAFAVPNVGSEVLIEFPFGDIYFPVYTGYWQSSETHQGDTNENYPDRYAWRDESGFEITVDKKRKTFALKHPTGAEISINEKGRIRMVSIGTIDMGAKSEQNQINVDAKAGTYDFTMRNSTQNVKELQQNFEQVTSTIGSIDITYKGLKVANVLGNKKDNVGGSLNESIGGSRAKCITMDESTMIGGKVTETIGMGRKTKIASMGDDTTILLGGKKTKILQGGQDTKIIEGGKKENIVAGGKSTTVIAGGIKNTLMVGDYTTDLKAGKVSIKNPIGCYEIDIAGILHLKGPAGTYGMIVDTLCQGVMDLATACIALTVIASGPSSPPVNAADFSKILATATQLKATIPMITKI